MTRIIYDSNVMKFMSLFESLTQSKLKDCIVSAEQIIFVVQEAQIAKAIGKHGANVHRLEQILNKRVKIVEFSDDVTRFIANFVAPLKVTDIKEDGGIVTITGPDMKTKGMLIGRDSKNLHALTDIVKRYFGITTIKVA